VSVETSDYSVGSAERAVALLEDVVRTCLDAPKASTKAWANGIRAAALATLAA